MIRSLSRIQVISKQWEGLIIREIFTSKTLENAPKVDVGARHQRFQNEAKVVKTMEDRLGSCCIVIEIPVHSKQDDLQVEKEVVIKKSKQNERMAWLQSPSGDLSQLLNQYKKLSKFRLTSLVVITTMAGYAIAPAPFVLSSFLMCSLGTGLVSAAANSINQYHEIPFDSQMSRTKNRVLITGQLTPLHSVAYAAAAGTVGLSMLFFGVNGLSAALGAGNFLLYTSVYTPLKRVSIANTWVGSVVGAIPPLMGWAGCTGSLDSGAWILAGLLYAWQFPHFNALSWNLRPDYSRAGYRMMAVTNPYLCRRTTLTYTMALEALCLGAPLADVTNIWFALETLPLNGYFIYLAYQFYKKSDSKTSRKLFRYSLVHLPLLMMLILVNKKQWFLSLPSMDELKKFFLSENLQEYAAYPVMEKLNDLPFLGGFMLSNTSKPDETDLNISLSPT